MVIKIQPKVNGQKQATAAKTPAANADASKKIGGSIYNQDKGSLGKSKIGVTSGVKTSSSLEKALAATSSTGSVSSNNQISNATQQTKIDNNESILKEAKAAAETCDTFESSAKTGLTLLTPAGITEMTTPATTETSETTPSGSSTTPASPTDKDFEVAWDLYVEASTVKSKAATAYKNGKYKDALNYYQIAKDLLEKAKEKAESSKSSDAVFHLNSIENSLADCKSQIHICEALISNACDSSDSSSSDSSNKSCQGGGCGTKTSNSSDGSNDKKMSWSDVMKNLAIALCTAGAAFITKAKSGNNPSQAAQGAAGQVQGNAAGRAAGKATATSAGQSAKTNEPASVGFQKVDELKNDKEALELGLQDEVNQARSEYSNLAKEFNTEGNLAAVATGEAAKAFQELGQARTAIQNYNGENAKIMKDIKEAVDNINREKQIVDKQTAIIEAQTKVKEENTEKKDKAVDEITKDDENIGTINNNLAAKKDELQNLNGQLAELASSDEQADFTAIHEKINAVNDEIERLEKELKEAEDNKKKHKAERDSYQKAIEAAESKIKTAEETKNASETKINDDLQPKLDTANKEKEKLNEQEKEMMKKFEDASNTYTQKLAEKEKHTENQNTCNDKIAIVDDKLNNLIQKAKAEKEKKTENE